MLLGLKMALLRQGKKQTRMAVDLGMDPARLSRIVHELAAPNPTERNAIAAYLGLDEENLFAQEWQPQTHHAANVRREGLGEVGH